MNRWLDGLCRGARKMASALTRFRNKSIANFRHLISEIALCSRVGFFFVTGAGMIGATAFLLLLNSLVELALPRNLGPATLAPSKPAASMKVTVDDDPLLDGTGRPVRPLLMQHQRSLRPVHVKLLRRYVARRATGAKGIKEGQRDYPGILVVEVASYHDPALNEHVIFLDLGYFDQRKDLRSIAWWQTKGLARSNEILVVGWSKPLTFIRSIDFPTNTNALTTYIRSYWIDFAQTQPHYKTHPELRLDLREADVQLAGELERILNEDFGHLQTSTPMIMLRVWNGFIQWLTLVFFMSASLVIIARWIVFVGRENREVFPFTIPEQAEGIIRDPSFDRDWAKGEIAETDQRLRNHQSAWNVPSFTLLLWKQAVSTYHDGGGWAEVQGTTTEFATLEQDKLSARAHLLKFLIGGMPALGFLGTVLGIGIAMMGTGGVLSTELAKQQSGVATVALALAFAFDTTFVALLLSLLASFLHSSLSAAEEQVLIQVKEQSLIRLRPITARSGRTIAEGERSAKDTHFQNTLTIPAPPQIGPPPAESSAVPGPMPRAAAAQSTLKPTIRPPDAQPAVRPAAPVSDSGNMPTPKAEPIPKRLDILDTPDDYIAYGKRRWIGSLLLRCLIVASVWATMLLLFR